MNEFIDVLKCNINEIDLSEFDNITLNCERKTKGTDNEYELMFKKIFLYNNLIEFNRKELPLYINNYIKKAKDENIIPQLEILNSNIEQNKMFFIYNIFGSQLYPDFTIFKIIENIFYFFF